MTGDSWSNDSLTRPLAGRSVYSLPACTLRWQDGQESVRFQLNRVAIGTDAANDVVLGDDTASRFHAEIQRQGDSYILRDLDSTNGIYIGEVRVREAFLGPGTVFMVGNTKLEFAPEQEVVQVQPSTRTGLGDLVGSSPAMRQLYALVEQIAPTDATVLLEGETGTGKEVVARTIHRFSRRAESDFVVVDCSAIPANLLESELFGHEKGSFSGALTGRKGLFESAHRGTVFLDEVGELPLDLQPKLLRVLETGEIRRVGSNRPLSLDVRIVAATNRNLQEEVKKKRFREDLFYRLNVVPVRLPPLREKREDIDELVAHILTTAAFNLDEQGIPRCRQLPAPTLDGWRQRQFGGNVRELANLVQREVFMVGLGGVEPKSSKIADDKRSWAPAPEEAGVPQFKEAKDSVTREFEENYFMELLQVSAGNISKAARVSGLDRKHLRNLLRKYGLYYSER